MKRSLIDNVVALPYESESIFETTGIQSAVLGIVTAAPTGSPTAARVVVTATECDTANGTFAPVADSRFFVAQKGVQYNDGVAPGHTAVNSKTVSVPHDASGIAQVYTDFIGAKAFVKLKITTSFDGGSNPSAAVSAAIAFGDTSEQPVEV